MVLAALSVFVNPRTASACSCGPPPPLVAFEGTVGAESGLNGLSGRDYDFRVDKAVNGDVRNPETVRVVTSDSRSSCAVGPRLIVGGPYRVSAYVSTAPNGSRLLAAAAGVAGLSAGAIVWRRRRS
jgi:hypothetical protein